MTLEQAKKIVDAAREEMVELTIYEAYSGRGMYGEETVGVTGDRADITHYAERAGIDSRTLSWDSMGKYDSIAYLPPLPWGGHTGATTMASDSDTGTAGHTPTPWVWGMLCVGRYVESGYHKIAMHPSGETQPEGGEWEANAAFIVRAVNSHIALVAALAALSDAAVRYGRAAAGLTHLTPAG